MSIGLRLDLRQTQQLVMTPQLQQAIKLLQMSNLEVSSFLDRALESNPLLELDAPQGPADPGNDALPEPGAETVDAGAVEAADVRLTEGDLNLGHETFDTGAEHLHDTSPGDGPPPVRDTGQLPTHGGGDDLPDLDQRLGEEISLRDHLLAQIGPMAAPAMTEIIARHLVEELDEHGYLRTDPAEIGFRLGASLDEVRSALTLVQRCEPTGVGACSLAECLALQLAERDRLDPAMRSMLDHLDLLERGELKRLRQVCGVDDEDFGAMLGELRALDPRPCAGFGVIEPETLIPDILITRTSWGGWHLELNPDTLPKLIMNTGYAAVLGGEPDDDARSFLADCRSNASWLIKSLDQRARTILRVSTEIVRRQEAFFTHGVSALRPLTLKDVAEAIDMHESTVSRVTTNKFMATDRGIFELKFFFTNSLGTGETHAAEAVRHRIKTMVDAEPPNAILSDDTIVTHLRQNGIDIARRTVAKYRKALKIPSSVERRRLKAIAGRDPAVVGRAS